MKIDAMLIRQVAWYDDQVLLMLSCQGDVYLRASLVKNLEKCK